MKYNLKLFTMLALLGGILIPSLTSCNFNNSRPEINENNNDPDIYLKAFVFNGYTVDETGINLDYEVNSHFFLEKITVIDFDSSNVIYEVSNKEIHRIDNLDSKLRYIVRFSYRSLNGDMSDEYITDPIALKLTKPEFTVNVDIKEGGFGYSIDTFEGSYSDFSYDVDILDLYDSLIDTKHSDKESFIPVDTGIDYYLRINFHYTHPSLDGAFLIEKSLYSVDFENDQPKLPKFLDARAINDSEIYFNIYPGSGYKYLGVKLYENNEEVNSSKESYGYFIDLHYGDYKLVAEFENIFTKEVFKVKSENITLADSKIFGIKNIQFINDEVTYELQNPDNYRIAKIELIYVDAKAVVATSKVVVPFKILPNLNYYIEVLYETSDLSVNVYKSKVFINYVNFNSLYCNVDLLKATDFNLLLGISLGEDIAIHSTELYEEDTFKEKFLGLQHEYFGLNPETNYSIKLTGINLKTQQPFTFISKTFRTCSLIQIVDFNEILSTSTTITYGFDYDLDSNLKLDRSFSKLYKESTKELVNSYENIQKGIFTNLEPNTKYSLEVTVYLIVDEVEREYQNSTTVVTKSKEACPLFNFGQGVDEDFCLRLPYTYDENKVSIVQSTIENLTDNTTKSYGEEVHDFYDILPNKVYRVTIELKLKDSDLLVKVVSNEIITSITPLMGHLLIKNVGQNAIYFNTYFNNPDDTCIEGFTINLYDSKNTLLKSVDYLTKGAFINLENNEMYTIELIYSIKKISTFQTIEYKTVSKKVKTMPFYTNYDLNLQYQLDPERKVNFSYTNSQGVKVKEIWLLRDKYYNAPDLKTTPNDTTFNVIEGGDYNIALLAEMDGVEYVAIPVQNKISID